MWKREDDKGDWKRSNIEGKDEEKEKVGVRESRKNEEKRENGGEK